MKIRYGFVSNSSSSSFIATTKGNTKIKLEIEIDLAEYTSYDNITTIDELEAYAKKEGWRFFDEDTNTWEFECKSYEEEYNMAKEAIDKGHIVLMGSFGSEDDDAISEFIYKNGIGDVKIPKGMRLKYENDDIVGGK